MKDGKLEKNEIALPQLISVVQVQTLEFKADKDTKEVIINAVFKVDTKNAQFEGEEVKEGNYVLAANVGNLSNDATPDIKFDTSDTKNTVKLNPSAILTKGFKHTGGI